MITARFLEEEGIPFGFEISGHAGHAEFGNDIVCASVSSAAYLTANGITDVILCEAEASVDEQGRMRLILEDRENAIAVEMIRSLIFHLENLAKDYPKNLKVFFDTEV